MELTFELDNIFVSTIEVNSGVFHHFETVVMVDNRTRMESVNTDMESAIREHNSIVLDIVTEGIEATV